jgi:uncharacterized protein (TIGR03086 family)
MTVEKTVFLPVSPDEAFALITEPERLRRWKTVSARVDLRAGGGYRWTIVPGHVAAGTFREVTPGRRVVYGWGWEASAELPPDTSTVTVTLEPADGGTRVRLVHEGLTPAQETSHLEGWTHFLARLARAAADGDAGPDEWAAAPSPMTPLTCADAALAACQHVLRDLGLADLAARTPCPGLTVEGLVDHLVRSLTTLGSMAGAGTETPTTSLDGPPATAESRVADSGQSALEAWGRRGLDGTVNSRDGEVPAGLAAKTLAVELLLHAWDVAAATSRQVTVSEEVTAYTLGIAEQVLTPQVLHGTAAPTVESAADARVLDRLIAYSGRAAV